MNNETFETKVAQRAGVPADRARALIRATLLTLGERLTRGEAHDLASQLPGPAKEWLVSPTPEAERFGVDEFINRVATRAGATREEARGQASGRCSAFSAWPSPPVNGGTRCPSSRRISRSW